MTDADRASMCDNCEKALGDSGFSGWYADNNGGSGMLMYCDDCEERRADRYGCALIIAEGCGCVPSGADCACGCGGSGLLR